MEHKDYYDDLEPQPFNFSDGPGGNPFDDAAGFWETGQHRSRFR